MPISDFRYNPFNNAMEPLTIVNEVHIIPGNSPYDIRLNEVPAKDVPSTVSVKFYGTETYLTEVGAPPSAEQFWCDYNTNDEDWNSGLIRFSSVDAGKVVQISYKGMGTLVGVKSARNPSWYYERGAASMGTKICGNGEAFDGVYFFNDFIVPPGVTIFINRTAKIHCLGAFINHGLIDGVGRNYLGVGFCAGKGGTGGGSDYFIKSGDPAAPEYANYIISYEGSAPSWAIESVAKYNHNDSIGGSQGGRGAPNFQDRPGGFGGAGGSGLIVIAKTILNLSTINMSGGNGQGADSYASYGGGGGGGGGGVVLLIGGQVAWGNVVVNGGAGAGGGRPYYVAASGYPGWYRFINLGEA